MALLSFGACASGGGATYGSTANELGAVWSLHDGTRTAIGTIDTSR